MANDDPSLLVQKLAATRATGAPADLSGFSLAVAKAARAAASELLRADCEAKVEMRSASLEEVLAVRAEAGVNYWLCDEKGARAFLISMTPQFAAAMTTRLLGGDFSLPEIERATAIDIDMAVGLIDLLTPSLDELAQQMIASARKKTIHERRNASSLKEAIGDEPQMLMTEMTIDFEIGGASIARAMSLAIPSRLLVHASDPTRKKAQKPEADGAWTRALKRQVMNMELPLAVVLDRIHTNVGDLSRLKVGQVIELNEDALDGLDITAMTDRGPASIAKGRLGAIRSQKAVKLTTGVDEDFLRGL
ncbi:MAG: FliM/FliN family flagellar motor switch protein [Amphiplicatus sp.]